MGDVNHRPERKISESAGWKILVFTQQQNKIINFPFHEILTKTIQYQSILSDKLTIFVQTLAVRLMGIKASFLGYFS